jgi:hypothetical protein
VRWANRSRAVERYLLCSKSREHDQSLTRPRDRYVQATFTTDPVQWTEVHRYNTAAVSRITHAHEHHVALVTLNVFQVLDEDRFGDAIAEERL